MRSCSPLLPPHPSSLVWRWPCWVVLYGASAVSTFILFYLFISRKSVCFLQVFVTPPFLSYCEAHCVTSLYEMRRTNKVWFYFILLCFLTAANSLITFLCQMIIYVTWQVLTPYGFFQHAKFVRLNFLNSTWSWFLDDITVGYHDLEQHNFILTIYEEFNDTLGSIDQRAANLIFGSIHKNIKSQALFLQRPFNHTDGKKYYFTLKGVSSSKVIMLCTCVWVSPGVWSG